MTEFLVLVLAISGLLVGLCAAGVLVAFFCGLVLHFFPNCALSRWIECEFFQTEYLKED